MPNQSLSFWYWCFIKFLLNSIVWLHLVPVFHPLSYLLCSLHNLSLTLFRMERGGKTPPPPRTSFSPITSTNVGISPKNYNIHLQYNLNHVIKFCLWCHGQELWRHNLYFKISLFQESWGSHFCWHYQNCKHVY